MTWKTIKDSIVTVLSSVLAVFQVGLSYLISCFQTVRVIGDCLSQHFSKNSLIEPKCPICKFTSWNCGIVLVTGLVSLVLIGWMVPRPKFIGRAEAAIWTPIKKKLPKFTQNWWG